MNLGIKSPATNGLLRPVWATFVLGTGPRHAVWYGLVQPTPVGLATVMATGRSCLVRVPAPYQPTVKLLLPEGVGSRELV